MLIFFYVEYSPQLLPKLTTIYSVQYTVYSQLITLTDNNADKHTERHLELCEGELELPLLDSLWYRARDADTVVVPCSKTNGSKLQWILVFTNEV